MRWRVLFFVSLGVNIALAAAWFAVEHRLNLLRITPTEPEHVLLVKTNVVIRRQYFSWAEVESTNYPAYIANLREIGCPEQTIRDIIIADVNALFARRRATEILTPEQQWWRSAPDPEVVQAAAAKIRALDEERRALLTKLLGPDWEGGDLASLPRPSRPTVALDGPILGTLPKNVKQSLEDLSARAQERMNAYLEAQRQQGKNPDPVEIAKLQQKTRDELAGILTPPQLEEYLLRYSQDANDLRAQLGQLGYFNATSNEFRLLFRATDPLDQQIQLLGDAADPSTVAQRNALLQQREDAIKAALGPNRYQQYVLLQDPAYRQAYATAQQAGTPDAVETLYAINLATAQQQAAINANTNLTAEQRAIELKRAELDQLSANAVALGQEIPPEEAPMPATNAPPAPPPMRTHPYVLGIGESAASIATAYGVPLDALRAANPDVNINRLRPGDVIRVPDSLPAR